MRQLVIGAAPLIWRAAVAASLSRGAIEVALAIENHAMGVESVASSGEGVKNVFVPVLTRGRHLEDIAGTVGAADRGAVNIAFAVEDHLAGIRTSIVASAKSPQHLLGPEGQRCHGNPRSGDGAENHAAPKAR